MSILNDSIVLKISEKVNKPPKYVKEQISKRARKQSVLSEVAMLLWARELEIPTSSYLRRLSPDIRAYFYSQPDKLKNDTPHQPTRFTIKLIGKDEKKLYNELWFQILVLGIAVSVTSQVIGAYVTNIFHLTNP